MFWANVEVLWTFGEISLSQRHTRESCQNVFVCPSRSEVFLFFTVRLMFDPTTKPQQMTNKSPREEPSERI